MKQDVFENIANAIKTIGKSRKKDTSVARRIIQTTIISSSTRQKCLTTQIAKVIETSITNITNFDYKYMQMMSLLVGQLLLDNPIKIGLVKLLKL